MPSLHEATTCRVAVNDPELPALALGLPAPPGDVVYCPDTVDIRARILDASAYLRATGDAPARRPPRLAVE